MSHVIMCACAHGLTHTHARRFKTGLWCTFDAHRCFRKSYWFRPIENNLSTSDVYDVVSLYWRSSSCLGQHLSCGTYRLSADMCCTKLPVADPRGEIRTRPLPTLSVQFLSFSCSFWQKCCQIMDWRTPVVVVGAPCLGDPGSATVNNCATELSTKNTIYTWNHWIRTDSLQKLRVFTSGKKR